MGGGGGNGGDGLAGQQGYPSPGFVSWNAGGIATGGGGGLPVHANITAQDGVNWAGVCWVPLGMGIMECVIQSNFYIFTFSLFRNLFS